VTCGYHEVIYTDKVKEVKEKRVKEGGIPWRVSSTMFGHLRHDVILEPIAHFRTEVMHSLLINYLGSVKCL